VLGDATNVKRIYVGNLSWSATEDQLREFFGGYGDVHSVAIITDRETGRSRGFGFVEMDDDGARQAISQGNGQALDGRPLRVSEANERPARRRYA
jgi:RNA recognition motif-containing protein